jgi:hypothetical protein
LLADCPQEGRTDAVMLANGFTVRAGPRNLCNVRLGRLGLPANVKQIVADYMWVGEEKRSGGLLREWALSFLRDGDVTAWLGM